MSGAVKIFLETGKPQTPEFVFVKKLLAHIGKPLEDTDITCVGGWTNLGKMFSQQVRKPEIEKILIIFDADSPANGGGFASRRSELDKIVAGNAKAKIFLFPNNRDDGDFETLLARIANETGNERFFDCFSDFETCLGDAYIHPDLKAKMFSYICFQKELSSSERNHLGRGEWLFDDKKYWDLDSAALDALKDFLNQEL